MERSIPVVWRRISQILVLSSHWLRTIRPSWLLDQDGVCLSSHDGPLVLSRARPPRPTPQPLSLHLRPQQPPLAPVAPRLYPRAGTSVLPIQLLGHFQRKQQQTRQRSRLLPLSSTA